MMKAIRCAWKLLKIWLMFSNEQTMCWESFLPNCFFQGQQLIFKLNLIFIISQLTLDDYVVNSTIIKKLTSL